MRNIYLRIDFFYIILRVCGVLTQDDEPPDPAISVSHVIPGSKYTKHLAVWGVYTNGENNIYGVGVLLNDHVVLSHTVINVTERKISASSRKEIHVGFTIVGSYRYPMRIPYSQADKFMDGSLYMKSSRADMPHLGLINIQATLRLHPYYVAPMKLPEHEYNGSKNCIIVGWGNFKDKFRFTHTDVFETKVQVMDVEACRTATDFPTLHDNCICILSELGDEVCEAAGGEPIICDGILTGIVGTAKCEEKRPRICANVFRAKDWIQEQLSILSASRASLHKFAVLYLVPIICRSQIKNILINSF